MLQTPQTIFYELMWQAKALGQPYPLPWWVQQYFRSWVEPYDQGLFDSKQEAFAANAYYRYWNMVGVKDHHQECLVGQAGEVEPVYDQYTLAFFLFDPVNRQFHFPQFPRAKAGGGSNLEQRLQDDYLPVIHTRYAPEGQVSVSQKVLATIAGSRERSVVAVRFTAQAAGDQPPAAPWLCLAVSPVGPTGFERKDRAGRHLTERRLTFMRYVAAERRVEVNTQWGPLFSQAPGSFGIYGNNSSNGDVSHYLKHNPYQDLRTRGKLNGQAEGTDLVGGLCTGVFAWPINLDEANTTFHLDVKLPVDDYRGHEDWLELDAADADQLEQDNLQFWQQKLDGNGMQMQVSTPLQTLANLYRTCRANLLMLSDHGQIHPGPTIYDSFWIRDSAVEGIACALAGDGGLSAEQFGKHYLDKFNFSSETLGPVNLRGFFGGEHEKNDREWDSNGQALWAFGRFDRISGPGRTFGKRLFMPYIVEGARWLRDNRSQYGLLHSGWSAEHVGDKDKPHYWDDLWGLAGLYEAGKLAQRIGAPEAGEIWSIYDDLRTATVNSIRWVLTEQRRQGYWQTFIPTGPGDVGRLDSTMIGAVAYFHPCRLYMGQKLGADIDLAAHYTLDTIWNHFVQGGGFKHDNAWNAFGPYLTLQLAHAFLYVGDLQRMEQLLEWSVSKAGFPKVSTTESNANTYWQVVLGAWNEQHCYPVATDFGYIPTYPWYMGDIPHGWACAELMMLVRDMLFFEADEDNNPHIYLAPGILPHWVISGETLRVSDAPMVFGSSFGYELLLEAGQQTVTVTITQPAPLPVTYMFNCLFGAGIQRAEADANPIPFTGRTVHLPAGTQQAIITYAN